MDKKLAQLLSAGFIALIFMTSVLYSAFRVGGAEGSKTSVTTTTAVQAIAILGYTFANVLGYSDTFSIKVSCSNYTGVTGYLGNSLIALESNNSVANFYSSSATSFYVQAGTTNSYALYQALSSGIGNSSSCTTFSAGAKVALPSQLKVSIPSEKGTALLSIPASARSYQIPVTFAQVMDKSMNLSVFGLVTENGTIFGNLSVSKAG